MLDSPGTYANRNPGMFLSVTMWAAMGSVATAVAVGAVVIVLAAGASNDQPAFEGLVALAVIVGGFSTAAMLYVYADYRVHTPDFVSVGSDRLVCTYGRHLLGPAEGVHLVVPLATVTRVVGGVLDRTWLNLSAGTWGPGSSGASSPGIQVASRRYQAKRAVLRAQGFGDSPWLYSEPNALNLTEEILDAVEQALGESREDGPPGEPSPVFRK